MVVLEEFAIVIMYLFAGVVAPALDGPQRVRGEKSLHSRESSNPEAVQPNPESRLSP